MTTDPLVIRYEHDVPARDGRRAFLAGEEYAVPDAATARREHPDAVIAGHLSGKPYTAKQATAENAGKAAPE